MNRPLSEPVVIRRIGSDTLWRYLDLCKFESLIKDKKFFLSRMDIFGDPIEGTVPKLNEEGGDDFLRWLRKKLRKACFVSCWCNYDPYDHRLRREYCKKWGIAIKSSIPRLRSQTPLEDDWCYLSHVVYLDYEKESFKFMFPKNPHTPLVHKREQFYYEKEYRVVKTVYEDVNYFAERGDEEGDNLFRVGRNRGQDRKRASWDRYYVNKPDPGLDPVFDDPAGRPETIWERAVKGDREKSWGISYKLSNLDFIEEVHVDPDAPKSHYEKVRNLIKNSAPELESRLIYKPINLYY